MTGEETNILTLNSFFLLTSEETHCLYLDKSMKCYLFQTKATADSFVENSSHKVKVEAAKNYVIKDYHRFYNLGAKGAKVFMREKNTIVDIMFDKSDIENKITLFFNNETNGNLNRLQQTSEKEYLSALITGTFFTPVIIEPRKHKEYPYLRYSYATFRDSEQYFILFSTLEEYETWAGMQDAKWQAMEITIEKFGRIRKKNPILINPLSNKLILTNKILRQVIQPKGNTESDELFAKLQKKQKETNYEKSIGK